MLLASTVRECYYIGNVLGITSMYFVRVGNTYCLQRVVYNHNILFAINSLWYMKGTFHKNRSLKKCIVPFLCKT